LASPSGDPPSNALTHTGKNLNGHGAREVFPISSKKRDRRDLQVPLAPFFFPKTHTTRRADATVRSCLLFASPDFLLGLLTGKPLYCPYRRSRSLFSGDPVSFRSFSVRAPPTRRVFPCSGRPRRRLSKQILYVTFSSSLLEDLSSSPRTLGGARGSFKLQQTGQTSARPFQRASLLFEQSSQKLPPPRGIHKNGSPIYASQDQNGRLNISSRSFFSAESSFPQRRNNALESASQCSGASSWRSLPLTRISRGSGVHLSTHFSLAFLFL